MFETTFLLDIAGFLDRRKEEGVSLTSWVPPGVWSFPPRTYLRPPSGSSFKEDKDRDRKDAGHRGGWGAGNLCDLLF